MAHFRGTVKGGRGMASRLGHANTGLRLHANSWEGSVEVELFRHKEHLQDWAYVRVNTGDGKSLCIYHGPLKYYQDPRGKEIPLYDYSDE